MTYLGGPYYPWWLDNLADDVIGDGAAFEHPAQGADAVRMIVLAARDLYEQHKFSFIGDYDDRFLEEYTCQIRGEPTHQRRSHGYPQQRRQCPTDCGQPPPAPLGPAIRAPHGREIHRDRPCRDLQLARAMNPVHPQQQRRYAHQRPVTVPHPAARPRAARAG
jgi:hypothetical protein